MWFDKEMTKRKVEATTTLMLLLQSGYFLQWLVRENQDHAKKSQSRQCLMTYTCVNVYLHRWNPTPS